MQRLLRPSPLLIVASALGHFGWGAVLPYQYVYASQTRGWGSLAGAAAASFFSLGALLGAVLIGHLTERLIPHRILLSAWILALIGVAGMTVADQPVSFAASTFVFGAGTAGASPAKSVLMLQWSSGEDQRRAFAYRFSAESVGMALGALLAGLFIDLERPEGMIPAYIIAALGMVLASGVGWAAARRAPRDPPEAVHPAARTPGVFGSLGRILAVRPLRWLALFTAAYSLGFYAQFEAGLPAYALTVLKVPTIAIGIAAATNCLAIAGLQYFMLGATAGREPTRLLVGVGWIWVLSWMVLAGAAYIPEAAAVLFISTYAIFAVGETIFTPVLNPLVARLAPAELVGTSIGMFAALLTTLSAVGPLIAGLFLSHGLSGMFVAFHTAVSGCAILAARAVGRSVPVNSHEGSSGSA